MDQKGHQRRILVIDDDEETRRFLSLIMTDSRWEVLFAEGPVQGLDLAAKKNPDLIVLDILMPEMDGFEVLKRLRENPVSAKTPVLILTGTEKDTTQDKAFGRGANEYLTKPLDIVRFYGKIDKLLPT